jgi:L-2,4-diaminobutyrate decarboxylase
MSRNAVYSGASTEEIRRDLAPLVDFQKEGISTEALHFLIRKQLLPHLMRYDNPGFQSMFNAFPEKGAELGSKIALQYNQGVTNWQVSPGGVVLEELCCDALCRLFSLAPTADATFMYSGTYANQEAIYLALHRKAEQCGVDLATEGIKGFADPSSLKIVTSKEVHFSVYHAARMLGLGDESIVTVGVDENYRIDTHALKETLNDLENVFCVVLTTGTTSTGSVDPVNPSANLCGERTIWLHVDGAYGLAYSLIPQWHSLFSGIDQADSICLDPHKQMGVPIPNSVLFVRRKEDFQRMAVYSDYFNQRESSEPNPGLKSPPSTRPFSALPLVASIRHQGLDGIVKRLRAPLTAVKETAEKVAEMEEIELCHAPDLGILCFRIIPETVPEKDLNRLHEYIYQEIMK